MFNSLHSVDCFISALISQHNIYHLRNFTLLTQAPMLNFCASSCSSNISPLQGENVKKELLELVDELPILFEKIAQETGNLKNCLKYYSVFVDFVLSK